MYKKIIFFEGVDGSGKTTYAKRLLLSDLPIKYFRSSYQADSIFAGEPVDLNESLKHDWRILLDFIIQTQDNSIIFVDRGFMSSYVYSKVVRHIDLEKWFLEYVDIAADFSEYWIFLRADEENLTLQEKQLNMFFEATGRKIQAIGSCVFFFRNYLPDPIDSFTNIETEIKERRFDADYYSKEIEKYAAKLRSSEVYFVDIDGTLLKNRELASFLDNKPIILITGRIRLDEDTIINLFTDLRPNKFEIITNCRNLGLSSRALKLFCIKEALKHWKSIRLIDDRKDVVEFIQSNLEFAKVEIKNILGLWYCSIEK